MARSYLALHSIDELFLLTVRRQTKWDTQDEKLSDGFVVVKPLVGAVFISV